MRRRIRFGIACACAIAGAIGVAGAARADERDDRAAVWSVPAEGVCRPEGGLLGAPGAEENSTTLPLAPGSTVAWKQIGALRRFLPQEVWEQRERFFHAGMKLVVGPCFRDYAPPGFFDAATEASRDRVTLNDDGGVDVDGAFAGLPFAPDTIDAADPSAGARWAWNVQERHQGAGFRGRYRITDLHGHGGRADPFEGEVFKLLLMQRTDRPGQRFQVPFANGMHWVAGGAFDAPAQAKGFAWRQYRSLQNRRDAALRDDLHGYRPEWRRVRRLPATDTEGLYAPTFRVELVALGQNAVPREDGVDAEIDVARSGFEGLEGRPILWSFRYVGQQDLLAPIDLVHPVWPEDADRDFGPFGLSFANDRWELRRALVLEAIRRAGPDPRGVVRERRYVDLQTLAPLYTIAFGVEDVAIGITIFAGRWSEDRSSYPAWPDERRRPLRVIDSAAAVFADLAGGASWRRESWDLVSTPPGDVEARKLESLATFGKIR
jgi:hypothetical protein